MIIKEPITKTIIKPGAIFNAEIETDIIGLDNFQSAKIVVASGEGTAKTVTAQVIATYADEEGEEKILQEKEITIGDNAETSFIVDADKFAHNGHDAVYLKIANAEDANILGCVFVVLGNERYSAES